MVTISNRTSWILTGAFGAIFVLSIIGRLE